MAHYCFPIGGHYFITRQGNWRGFVKDVNELQLYDGIFVPVLVASSVFSFGIPPFEVWCQGCVFVETATCKSRPYIANGLVSPVWI